MRMTVTLPLLLVLFIWMPLQAQDFAQKQLEESPRYHEWIKLKSGERTLHCFVAYPENKDSTSAVILIHENQGLNDWMRLAADQVAAQGFIAIVPDLLSGFDLKNRRSSDFASSEEVVNAIEKLGDDQITQDLDAAFNYILAVPSCNGKVFAMGFGWGGTQAFRYTTNNAFLRGAIVFYGTSYTEKKDLKRTACPIYGLYAANDDAINETIDPTMELMSEVNRDYDYTVFQKADHGFMRLGDDPTAAGTKNQEARDAAWQMVQAILSGQ